MNRVKITKNNNSFFYKLSLNKWKNVLIVSLILLLFSFVSVGILTKNDENLDKNNFDTNSETKENISVDAYKENIQNLISTIPKFSDSPYFVVNNNIPFFSENDLVSTSYESYSDLDKLERCQVAIACIGKDLMPTEKRGEIGNVRPTGWHLVRYNGIDGNYLYNRCHLIGYQLSGENANEKNLITGTRYLNVQGMLPFENKVAEYVKSTGNHVLYRVTPIFENENLLVSGVLMEAQSVEDNGASIKFNVYCYNVQPEITINYSNGESSGPEFTGSNTTATTNTTTNTADSSTTKKSYVVNKNTKVFHYSYCSSVQKMSDKNKQYIEKTRDNMINDGYTPCKICNP